MGLGLPCKLTRDEPRAEEQELYMALTRSMLKAMGIEDEKIDQIVEAHAETVEGLKKQADELREETSKAKEQAQKAQDLQRKLEEAEAKIPTEDWQARYAESVKEFEAYKAKAEAEKAEAEKRSLYRALLREVGVDEKRIDAVVKVTDLGGIAVKDGALADADALKESVASEWAAFIPQKGESGATVETPQQTQQATGADPATVQRLAERHERLYGKVETDGKEGA